MHISDKDFFQRHRIDCLDRGSAILAEGNYGGIELAGGQDGKALATGHLDDAGELRQDRTGWNDQPDTPPAVEEVFLFLEGNEASAINKGDAVGDLLDFQGIVRGEEDGAPLVGEHGHQFAQNFAPRHGIEAGCGLVEYEQARLSRQSKQELCLDSTSAG